MDSQRKKISRRDFFQLAGVSVGASLAASAVVDDSKPVHPQRFRDPAGRPQRPWWVKIVKEPTTEINWDLVERFDERFGSARGPGFVGYVGDDRATELSELSNRLRTKWVRENKPGYTLKEFALDAAHNVHPTLTFLGPQGAKTPEEWGTERWQGTPEQAARIVRAAMRHLGASQVGFIALDENTRKLIYSVDPDGKELIFTDDPVASETEQARYIPNRCKWVIVYTVQMSEETLKRAPTMLAAQTTGLAYRRGDQIQASTQEFLRGLGYQCLGSGISHNALGIAPAFGVLAGLGEMGRMNRMITPEFGPMVRVFRLLTDLPLATDKPIDAGIQDFCKQCKKCAEACPPGAISLADEPSWEIQGQWNSSGHKAWFDDALACRTYWLESTATNCGICFAVCPFSKKDKAWIHDWVRASIATAPVLNSFIRSMDDGFGYGAVKDQEEWWDLDLPELGIDTTRILRQS